VQLGLELGDVSGVIGCNGHIINGNRDDDVCIRGMLIVYSLVDFGVAKAKLYKDTC
jgi:hypothetical protein